MFKTTKDELRRVLYGLRGYLGKDNAFNWLTISASAEHGIVCYAVALDFQAVTMATLFKLEGEITEEGIFSVGGEFDVIAGSMPEGDAEIVLLRNANNEPATMRIMGANKFKARLQVQSREGTEKLLVPIMGKFEGFNEGFSCIIPKDELTNLIRLSRTMGINPQGNGMWVILDARDDGMYGMTQDSEIGALEELGLSAQYNGTGTIVISTNVLSRALLLCRSEAHIRGGADRRGGSVFTDPDDQSWRSYVVQTALPGER